MCSSRPCECVIEEDDAVVSFLLCGLFVRQPFISHRGATAVKNAAASFISGPARVLLQQQLGTK